jgi:hypothetical protein
VGSFKSAHINGTHVPVEEPSTASGADVAGRVKKCIDENESWAEIGAAETAAST